MAAPSTLSHVANTIHAGAKDILQHSGSAAEIAAELTRVLTKFLTWPYVVGPASIHELEGTPDSHFDPAICTVSTQTASDADAISSARVACVFHAAHTLTTDELKEGYRRIAAVKRLKRSPARPAGTVNDVPLGVIFCIESASPLETI